MFIHYLLTTEFLQILDLQLTSAFCNNRAPTSNYLEGDSTLHYFVFLYFLATI